MPFSAVIPANPEFLLEASRESEVFPPRVLLQHCAYKIGYVDVYTFSIGQGSCQSRRPLGRRREYELAAWLIEQTGDRFAGSEAVARAKRLVYLKLMEKNQNTDPFKFIIYSGKIGEQTPQMTTGK